jgi:hypothetical protein
MLKVQNVKLQPIRNNLTFTLPLCVLSAYAPGTFTTTTTRTFVTNPQQPWITADYELHQLFSGVSCAQTSQICYLYLGWCCIFTVLDNSMKFRHPPLLLVIHSVKYEYFETAGEYLCFFLLYYNIFLIESAKLRLQYQEISLPHTVTSVSAVNPV